MVKFANVVVALCAMFVCAVLMIPSSAIGFLFFVVVTGFKNGETYGKKLDIWMYDKTKDIW